jgi:DNA-binding IclR family transcriptional regulator
MTLSPRLPLSVIAFMRTHVDSLEKLMLLLIVHRAPSGSVSLAVLARMVNVTPSQARSICAELAEHGLVHVSQADLVELAVPPLDDRLALAELALWYVQDRATVLDALVALGRSAS